MNSNEEIEKELQEQHEAREVQIKQTFKTFMDVEKVMNDSFKRIDELYREAKKKFGSTLDKLAD